MGVEKSRRTFYERSQILKAIEAKEMTTRQAVEDEVHHLLSPDPEYTAFESGTDSYVHSQADEPTSLIGQRTDF